MIDSEASLVQSRYVICYVDLLHDGGMCTVHIIRYMITELVHNRNTDEIDPSNKDYCIKLVICLKEAIFCNNTIRDDVQKKSKKRDFGQKGR